ncbi:MAG: hypothetical protein ACLQVI_08880 [Polyangiaceae bacterium]
MCLTLGPARLSDTVLYAAETRVAGKLAHVMGYQNRAENLSPGPNAMILPIPASVALGANNMLDTSKAKSVLSDHVRSLWPVSRGAPQAFGASLDVAASVTVFDKGNYTVVLATDARSIPAAMDRVPANKRPPLNQTIFDAYAAWYSGWHVALCCFERSFEVVDPLLWWYEPIDPTRLFAPSLDGHDGGVPQPGPPVGVDHKLVFGSVTKPEGRDVFFTDYTNVAPDRSGLRTELPDDLRPLLATRVTGAVFADRRMPNGDFSLPIAQLASPDSVMRVSPPGA